MSEWRDLEWGDIATLAYGKALRDYRDSRGSTAVFGTNGPIGTTQSRPHSPGPGVVVGRKGAYRGVHYSPGPFVVIDTAFWIKPREPFDMRWAYYELLTHDINAMDSGSAIPSTSREAFYRLPVSVPPPEEQRAIAATLGALDDKIESNRRLISIIPALIRAHVKQATAATANQVPISSLARFVNGGAYTKGATGQGRMVIRIAELNGGPGGSTVYTELDVPDDKTARPGDLLMSWSGSLGVYRWARAEAIINQHIFKVLPSGWPAWLVFDRLDAVIGLLREIAKDKATTMGHIQRGHLDTTIVNVPDPETVALLDAVVGPLWTRLLVAEQEVLTLGSLRDALLPELLSGHMRVADLA